MHEEWTEHVSAITARLSQLARNDADLRHHLRTLARQINTFVDGLERDDPNRRNTHSDNKTVSAAGQRDRWAANSGADEVDAAAAKEKPLEREAITDGDLRLIQERCLLKKEAVHWCMARRFDGGDVEEEQSENQKRDLIERAKALPDCYLWMLYPWTCTRGAGEDWESLSESFENLSRMSVLLQALLPHRETQREFMEQAIRLSAEVQSALRVSVDRVGNRMPDPDQEKCFWWLRRTTEEQRIFVQRYMKWTDPAEPDMWEDIRNRIQQMDDEIHQQLNIDPQASQLLNKARFHVKMIDRNPDDSNEQHWQIINEVLEDVVNHGIDPSGIELRELILPLIDDLPEVEEEHPVLCQVLNEIEIWLHENNWHSTSLSRREPTEDVAHAAELLRGKKVLMIAGVPRPEVKLALEEALELKELVWLDSREYEAVDQYQSIVADPETILVLWAAWWCSCTWDEIRDCCDAEGKILVSLPGGYAPNQAARQILDQAHEALAE